MYFKPFFLGFEVQFIFFWLRQTISTCTKQSLLMEAERAEHLSLGWTMGLAQCGACKKRNEEKKLFSTEKEAQQLLP